MSLWYLLSSNICWLLSCQILKVPWSVALIFPPKPLSQPRLPSHLIIQNSFLLTLSNRPCTSGIKLIQAKCTFPGGSYITPQVWDVMALCTQPRCSWGSSFFFPWSLSAHWLQVCLNVSRWFLRESSCTQAIFYLLACESLNSRATRILWAASWNTSRYPIPSPAICRNKSIFWAFPFLLTVLSYGNIMTMRTDSTAAETIRVKAENSAWLRGHGSPLWATDARAMSLERPSLKGKQGLCNDSKLVLYIWSTPSL